MSAKELVIALTASESGVVPLSEVRSRTNTLVYRAGTELIEDLLAIMVDNTEISNEILCEVWAIITEEGLWKAKFASKDEATTVLDSTLLQDLRKRAQTNRGRKNKYRKSIQQSWGSAVDDWSFADIGGNPYVICNSSCQKILLQRCS